MTDRVENLLINIGLTGLESSAYVALLREPGATAYRVSQMIGKPPPNTYKALDSLLAKGAVVADASSGSKSYAALPIGEFLNSKRRTLDAQQVEIERSLADVAVESVEHGIFRLTTIDQVYERCRTMITDAESLVLIDAFPRPLAELKKAAVAAAKRGVDVFIKPYAPTSIPGCDVIGTEAGAPQLDVWNGDWLNVVADCSESVQAFLAKDGAGVHAAAWCRNPYLAMLDFNGMVSEFILTRVIQLAEQGSDGPSINREIKRLTHRYMKFEPFVSGIPDAWLIHPKQAPQSGKKHRGR
jgi:HTH-type transcriptional regulator, sugar sensing transcriptional regulator